MRHPEPVPNPATAAWPTAPAKPGFAQADIDTPAMLIDLDALEHNMRGVHDRVLAAGVAVRPHAKAHKCVEIARRQVAAGAQGICCQKASEAEVFVNAGFSDVLITNQVVGADKCGRVARLAAQARIGVCVDHLEQVRQIGEAARVGKVCVDVLIEVDIGHGRCGIASPEAALTLVRALQPYQGNLAFRGIHAFRGSAQHMREPADRARAVQDAVTQLKEIVARLEDEGFHCATVTGGGTGTYLLEALSGLYTEVQPGSYVLMDIDYATNRNLDDTPALRHALFGLCTVISVRPDQVVLDGGLKAFAVDQGLPRALHPGWTVKSLSDEHTILLRGPGAAPLHVGDKVRMLPGHCDPTVNLHDWLVAVRGDIVQEVWPVSARGALF